MKVWYGQAYKGPKHNTSTKQKKFPFRMIILALFFLLILLGLIIFVF